MKLDQAYWEQCYVNHQSPWDMGSASTPLISYLEKQNRDASIFIPGAGRAWEVDWMLEQGFTDITVIDLSSTALQEAMERIPHSDQVKWIEGNFFEHIGHYDLIMEQTFFCALDPQLRPDYALKMKSLLKEGGKLFGLLFNFPLSTEGPPFGGSKAEYLNLFQSQFKIHHLEICYNSIKPRAGREFFLELEA
ncbi:methyltransferase domain-containing protein [Croceimicrobium hydrocarbonivorans]|uniref:Methyltransferase domain-containing protein n=1 Tax=Croceimicrobium hydrocarbonivorans TaxID=2761580 RepID=A0A7H0VEX0_9FLAO|nr:methyltransferase domain-containing protein [Croceimicrobium hydrocarbonivorans]QNR24268.1 methyltransferase domain-containing protein [Croceimicrobium hydrocarbonivorans]